MSAPVRLFISDLDGTLIRNDKTLADATVAAVQRLTEAGLPMTLISARPPSGMMWVAEKLNLDGPFGAFNGGVLFKRDGTVIERHCLDAKVAETILSLFEEAGITCWVFAVAHFTKATAASLCAALVGTPSHEPPQLVAPPGSTGAMSHLPA